MSPSGSSMEANELRVRLQNCLQTILDLRGELDAMPLGASFMPEIGSLENFLARLGQVRLDEAEVLRIEQATGKFLSELKMLMEHDRNRQPGKGGLLQ